ncbi:hypothetical protein EIC84_20700 [Comamonas sp. A23]|nr:hypothetical protein EIC84_20700 [Comamonas sp. A23]
MAVLGRSQSYAPELHPPLRQSRDDRWIPIHTVHKRVCQTFLRHWKVHNNAYPKLIKTNACCTSIYTMTSF